MAMRRPTVALALAGALLAGLPAAAQTPSQAPGWIADGRTGCRIWNQAPKPNQSVSWSGGCQNRLAQGRGVLQWFLNGKPHDRYDGELVSGKYDGHGTYLWADSGFHYEGEWRDGKANGPGALTTQKDSFKGAWTDGCFREGARRAWIGVAPATCK
jgi:hypothetical protein